MILNIQKKSIEVFDVFLSVFYFSKKLENLRQICIFLSFTKCQPKRNSNVNKKFVLKIETLFFEEA